MVDQGKRILDVQVKTSLANTDELVIVYNANNNTTAQTALITKSNFLSDVYPNNAVITHLTANGFSIQDVRADPSNSTVTVITKGQMFVSSGFLYVATDNNHLKRVPLSDF